MQSIPLQPVDAQTLTVMLDGKNYRISLTQKPKCLFADITVDGVSVAASVIARDCVQLVPVSYGGNLIFVDSQGSSDPTFAGIGSRFELIYLTAEEYVLFQQ